MPDSPADQILSNRRLELRLVNLHPRRAVFVQERAGLGGGVAPRAMPQLDRQLVFRKRFQEPAQVINRLVLPLKAERELNQERSELAGGGKRIDPALERIDVGLRDGTGIDGHVRVGELLVHLHRELEVPRRALDPAEGGVGARLAIEGAVHLDGVEALRVEAQLVKAAFAVLGQRIEDAVPRTLAGRVVPAGGPDPQRHTTTIIFCPASGRAARLEMLTVNEIFHSIQGESTHAGRPCVFVRLTACDLRCRWCDTPYAFHEGRKMSVDEVVADVEARGCDVVEVTGGEPLLQPDVYPLMQRLLDCGKTVLIETGGHRSIAEVPDGVIRIMDVKCPGSGESAKNDWTNLAHLGAKDEVKFVIADRADYEFARDLTSGSDWSTA